MLLAFSPFYFQDFGSSFISLLWVLFQVDCIFPLHLFGLVGFHLAPSSAMYFSVSLSSFLSPSLFLSLFCFIELILKYKNIKRLEP